MKNDVCLSLNCTNELFPFRTKFCSKQCSQDEYNRLKKIARALSKKPSKRRLRYNAAFKNRIRFEIMARDNNQCTKCGTVARLAVHHKDINSLNDAEENLITLCKACHRLEHTYLPEFLFI